MRSQMMMAAIVTITLVFAALPVAAQSVTIAGANIVDVVNERVFIGSIVIADGKVQRVIEQKSTMRTDFEGQVIDGTSKFVIPGLFDMHTHAWGNPKPIGDPMLLGLEGAAQLMLYAGVTGFMDLFSPEGQIFQLREQQRQGKLMAADIFASGPCLTSPGGHCSEFSLPTRIINSPEGAAAEVREVAKYNPDVIKVVYDHAIEHRPTITAETLEAVLLTAKKLNLKTVVHIGTWDDAREAIRFGATAITHLYHEVIPDDIVQAARKKRVRMIPTLTVQRSLVDIIEDASLLSDPFLKELTTPSFLENYTDFDQDTPRMEFYLDYLRKLRATNHISLRKLVNAGVTILPGTDVGNLGTFVGYSLHRELELLVKSGMSTWQALRSATVDSADFLGVKYGYSSGARANFLILNRSPVDDIKATRDIFGVVYRGTLIDRQKIKPWKS